MNKSKLISAALPFKRCEMKEVPHADCRKGIVQIYFITKRGAFSLMKTFARATKPAINFEARSIH